MHARSVRARPFVVIAGALLIVMLLGPDPDSNPLNRLRTGITEPTVEMLTHQMKAWHYRPYHVLQQLAPRADYLVLDGSRASRNARPEELIAVAGASSVALSEGPFVITIDESAEAHEVRDRNDAGEWTVVVAVGPPPDLILVLDDPTTPGAVLFLDHRLAGGAGDEFRSVSPGSSLRRDRVGDRSNLGRFVPTAWAEAIFLVVVLIGGSLLVPRERFPAWAVPAAGIIAGSALLAVVGTGVLALGFPGSPGLTLLASAAIAGAVGIGGRARRARPPSKASALTRRGLLASLPSAAAIALMSAVLHADGIVSQQRDGVEHVMRGVVLARGGSVEILRDFYTLNLRMVGLASVHSLSSLWGAEFLIAWVPVLAVATVVLTAVTIRQMTGPVLGDLMGALLGLAGAVILISMPMFLYTGLSHLPHIPIAGAATLLYALMQLEHRPRLTDSGVATQGGHLIGLLGMSLVLIKPDGLFVAVLLLLGMKYLDRRKAVVAWRYVGLAMVAWQTIMLRAGSLSGIPPSRDVLAQVLAGLVLLAFSGVLLRLSPRAYALITSTPLVVIGGALLLSALTGRIDGSIFALRTNLFGPDGGWGMTMAVLLVGALVAAVAAILVRSDELRALTPIVLGLPAVFLLIPVFTVSIGGGYRIGISDSMNRMWINILPLLVILTIVALSTLRWRSPERSDQVSPTLDGWEATISFHAPIAAATATVGMLIVAAVLPNLPPAEQDPVVLISTGSTDDLHPIGEIMSNVEVITRLDFSGSVPISPALHGGRLCIDLLPANYADRANIGSHTLELRLADRSEWWVVEMEGVEDFVPLRHCLERLRPRDLDALLLGDAGLTISGGNGQRGTSTTLMFTRDPSSGSVLRALGLSESIPDGYIPLLGLVVEPAGGLRWMSAVRRTGLVALLALLIGGWEGRRSRATMVRAPVEEL